MILLEVRLDSLKRRYHGVVKGSFMNPAPCYEATSRAFKWTLPEAAQAAGMDSGGAGC